MIASAALFVVGLFLVAFGLGTLFTLLLEWWESPRG